MNISVTFMILTEKNVKIWSEIIYEIINIHHKETCLVLLFNLFLIIHIVIVV